MRGYAYEYDALNRLLHGYYRKNQFYFNNFDEVLSYDKNGNIKSLNRWGTREDLQIQNSLPDIDQLNYTYYDNSNKLKKVDDLSASTSGFKDGISTNSEYFYDPNGNMIRDLNKKIGIGSTNGITYNHLNLPKKIKFNNSESQKIEYIYNAAGIKITKKVTNGFDIKTTDYLDGFQYVDGELQFFPTAEGYVRMTEDQTTRSWYDYVYNYTDHLGNIRLSYTNDPGLGLVKKVEENHYYPFGLEHGIYNGSKKDYKPTGDNREILSVSNVPYKYKYQGQERQDELDLNWDSFKWRNYDYAIGRFMSVDPIAEEYVYNSPYAFSENRVMDGRELEGLEWSVSRGNDGNYMATLKIQPLKNLTNEYSAITEEVKSIQDAFATQIKSSLDGRISDKNLNTLTVNVVFSEDATIGFELRDTVTDVGTTEEGLVVTDADKVIQMKTPGMVNTINDTQNNRIQLSSRNLLYDDKGNKLGAYDYSAQVNKVILHEGLHTGGLRHGEDYQKGTRAYNDVVGDGYNNALSGAGQMPRGGHGMNVLRTQKRLLIKAIENDQQKTEQ